MTVRLKRMEIGGFRGFAECRPIDLDADVIVVRGDNGTGKTSMVDALLWLFCGELEYLVERVRGLRRKEDAVTSRFNPNGATVTLALDVDGVEHLFVRTGTERTTHLKVLKLDESLEDAAAETGLRRSSASARPASFTRPCGPGECFARMPSVVHSKPPAANCTSGFLPSSGLRRSRRSRRQRAVPPKD